MSHVQEKVARSRCGNRVRFPGLPIVEVLLIAFAAQLFYSPVVFCQTSPARAAAGRRGAAREKHRLVFLFPEAGNKSAAREAALNLVLGDRVNSRRLSTASSSGAFSDRPDSERLHRARHGRLIGWRIRPTVRRTRPTRVPSPPSPVNVDRPGARDPRKATP